MINFAKTLSTMEYIIKLSDKKVFDSLVWFLKSIGIKIVSPKNPPVDEITIISQKALAEEWN